MVIKHILMMNKGMTEDKLKEYEFHKCNRCLYEKTLDEFGETKKGRRFNNCFECRGKENHYRLKKKSDDYELNLNRHKHTSDIIKHQHTIDYLNENFPSYPEEP